MAINITSIPGYSDAQIAAAIRTALPTELNSAQMQAFLANLPVELRTRILFTSRCASADILGGLRDVLDTTGEVNRAQQRVAIRDLLQTFNYEPPTGEEGTIGDLSSTNRINLFLDTNFARVNGLARFAAMQDQDVLDPFPCRELRRDFERDHPRGSPDYKGAAAIGWDQRWLEAAQTVGDLAAAKCLEENDRMIARADSDIWDYLGTAWGDSIGDGGVDPLAFGTGYRQHPVPRSEAVELGVIEETDRVEPQEIPPLNDGLQKTVIATDADFLAKIEHALQTVPELSGLKLEDGVLKFK